MAKTTCHDNHKTMKKKLNFEQFGRAAGKILIFF
jgi:hypothetical protein